MNRQVWILGVIFGLLSAASALAQLSLESKSGFTVSGLESPTEIAGVLVVGPKSKPVLSPIAIVTIKTDAANVEIEIEDSARNQLPAEEYQAAPNVLRFTKAGRYWLEVTAIDFPKNIYAKRKLTVEVLPAQPSGPDPIDNTETFNGLAGKVAAAVVGFDPADKAKYYQAYATVAAKMKSYEIKTVREANAFLASQALSCRNLDACRRFSQLLTDEAAAAGTLSFAQSARWFELVAEGLK